MSDLNNVEQLLLPFDTLNTAKGINTNASGVVQSPNIPPTVVDSTSSLPIFTELEDGAVTFIHSELNKLSTNGTIDGIVSFLKKLFPASAATAISASAPSVPNPPAATFDAEKHYDKH